MGGGKIADPKKRVGETFGILKPTDTSLRGALDPTVKGGIAQTGSAFAFGHSQTELMLKHTAEDLGLNPPEIPVPAIPELEGMSAADITLKAQAAREEERRKMAGRRGRQSTIVTGPLGIQSAASTTRGPI